MFEDVIGNDIEEEVIDESKEQEDDLGEFYEDPDDCGGNGDGGCSS